jgi:hypothetical protein
MIKILHFNPFLGKSGIKQFCYYLNIKDSKLQNLKNVFTNSLNRHENVIFLYPGEFETTL